jgi:hypothetical protein
MIVSIEYDDGKPIELKGKAAEDRGTYVTPRGRRHGFYVRFPNGKERQLSIGYMRVSEMQRLETVFNEMMVNL